MLEKNGYPELTNKMSGVEEVQRQTKPQYCSLDSQEWIGQTIWHGILQWPDKATLKMAIGQTIWLRGLEFLQMKQKNDWFQTWLAGSVYQGKFYKQLKQDNFMKDSLMIMKCMQEML